MSVSVKRIPAADWAKLSEQAHLVVFGEHKPASWERIDFALVTEGPEGLRTYVTCREISFDAVYIPYGGAFPTVRGSAGVVQDFQALLGDLRAMGFRKVGFLVENTNRAMLKLALHVGFLITGVRNFEGSILVEHYLKLGGE